MNPIMKLIGGILKVLKTPLKLWTEAQKLTAVITGLSVILAGLTVTTVVLHATAPEAPETTVPSTTETLPPETTTEPTTVPPTTEPTTVPTTEPGPVITDKVLELRELHKENPDTFGWIWIPDTRVDDIVMYTPNEPSKYLYKDFNGNFRARGLVYIEKFCSMDPEDMIVQIVGHNMLSGVRFADLLKYDKQEFWEEHPYIWFTTMEGARTYEVVTAGYDQVIGVREEGFKYYQFINPVNDEELQKGLDHFFEHSEIDTGVKPEFGDRFIMLCTCAYHTENGRFLVLAREVPYVEPPVTE